MNFLYGVTVTVERPAGQDADGNPLGPPSEHTVDGCAPAPAGSSEDYHLAATVEWDYDLLAPFGSDFESSDVVLGDIAFDGDTTRYQVHGRPQSWRSPFTGWGAGLVVRLKAVS